MLYKHLEHIMHAQRKYKKAFDKCMDRVSFHYEKLTYLEKNKLGTECKMNWELYLMYDQEINEILEQITLPQLPHIFYPSN